MPLPLNIFDKWGLLIYYDSERNFVMLLSINIILQKFLL
jgi:hypothetical protein